MATKTGRQAEAVAAEYLERQGHKIVFRNWRTRWCELDLIAVKTGVTHVIEVKYRASADFGSAESYVTPAKLKQLELATRYYQAQTNPNRPIQIDVIAIEGNLDNPKIELIESVTA